ncbi:uncharacterized protein [Centruroides vittatus]|uniref:uncharacterized protein n=1 Tax=Centruroides vittatus TaxID=120091 RepID=UPI00351060B5
MNLINFTEIICLLFIFQGWNFIKTSFLDDARALSEHELNFCRDKQPGNNYADVQSGCRMYYKCLLNNDGRMLSYKIECPNDTYFNEEKQQCQQYIARCRNVDNYELKRFRRQQPPSYSYHNLPKTNFSCIGKSLGGYYADAETDCQMFHICTPGENNSVIDIMFLCGNGTVFDQKKLVCERYGLVDCRESASFLDEEEERLREDEIHRKLADVEITRITS